jgi:hypothetical protein
MTMVGEATASISIRLRLDREVMRVGERNNLTVDMSSDKGSPPNPYLPQIDGLSFYSLGQDSTSISMNIVGSQRAVEYRRTLAFVVVPSREGTYEIKGVTVKYGAESAVADPVKLTVLKAGAPTPIPTPIPYAPPGQQGRGGGDFQLIAEVSKSKAYVGEAVAVRYILLGSPGIIQQIESFGNLGPGLFKRCVVEEVDLGELRRQPQRIGGQIVEMIVLKHFILFPLSAGPIEVEPVTLTLDVRPGGRRPSFFDFPFERTVQTTAACAPLRINVEALPTAGRPEGFDGAVGDFKLEAAVDKRELVEGDPLSLQLVLAGNGNIRNCPPPMLPDLSGFDQYESTKKEDVSVAPQGVSGRITYEYVLVPKALTSTEIGPVRLFFFNPGDGQYHTISTDSIHLTIRPRSQGSGDRVLLAAGAGTKREIVLTGEDFRHIVVGVAGSAQERLDLYRRPSYIVLMVAPFLVLGGVAAYARHRRRLEMDPEYARHRRAPRMARRLLAEARQAVKAGDRDTAYAAFLKTLVDYVGNRWNLAAVGMTTSDLGRHLRDRGVSEECVGGLIAVLEEFEACRFGGNTDYSLRSDLQRTEEVLGRLMASGKHAK